MSITRRRVFESALNDVTYWEGRPLKFREGLEYMDSNSFVAAAHNLHKRQEAVMQKRKEARRQQHLQ